MTELERGKAQHALVLRRNGLNYRQIGQRLGVTTEMARRRVLRGLRLERDGLVYAEIALEILEMRLLEWKGGVLAKLRKSL